MTRSPIVWKHAKGLTTTSPFLTFPHVQSTVSNTELILKSQEWKVPTSVIWGMKDRWLPFEGVAQYCRGVRADLSQLSEVILTLILRCDGNKVNSNQWTERIFCPSSAICGSGGGSNFSSNLYFYRINVWRMRARKRVGRRLVHKQRQAMVIPSKICRCGRGTLFPQ